MKRVEITLREFLLEYATTFFRQHIAYCLQEPIYASQTTLLELLDYSSDHKAANRS